MPPPSHFRRHRSLCSGLDRCGVLLSPILRRTAPTKGGHQEGPSLWSTVETTLPTREVSDTRAWNRVRQLRLIQGGGPDTSREIRVRQEFSGGLSAAGDTRGVGVSRIRGRVISAVYIGPDWARHNGRYTDPHGQPKRLYLARLRWDACPRLRDPCTLPSEWQSKGPSRKGPSELRSLV